MARPSPRARPVSMHLFCFVLCFVSFYPPAAEAALASGLIHAPHARTHARPPSCAFPHFDPRLADVPRRGRAGPVPSRPGECSAADYLSLLVVSLAHSPRSALSRALSLELVHASRRRAQLHTLRRSMQRIANSPPRRSPPSGSGLGVERLLGPGRRGPGRSPTTKANPAHLSPQVAVVDAGRSHGGAATRKVGAASTPSAGQAANPNQPHVRVNRRGSIFIS